MVMPDWIKSNFVRIAEIKNGRYVHAKDWYILEIYVQKGNQNYIYFTKNNEVCIIIYIYIYITYT